MAQSRMVSVGSLIGSLAGAALAIALLVWAPWWLLLAALLLLALWTVATRIGRQAWSVTEVGLATIPLILGIAHLIPPIPGPGISTWVAVTCGLILGAGTMVLTGIAFRARLNKGLD